MRLSKSFALLACASLAALCAGAASAADLKIVQRIPGPDGGWDYASYDAAHARVLVARTDGVMAVDTAAGTATGKWVPGARLHGAIGLPGNLGLSTNGGDNTATIFDSGSGKVIASVPTGTNPDAAVYDPASATVYVMNGRGGDITVIDPKAAKAVATIAVGGKLEFAAPDGKGRMFVNVEDKGEIAVIDTKTHAVTARWAMAGCEDPSGLVLDEQAGVLVSVCANGHAMIVSTATGAIVKDVAIGKGPDAVMYDAKRKLAFVPCGQDAELDVIDMSNPKTASVVARVATQRGARTGALDTKTGKIYLPAAKYGPPAKEGGRPVMIPGSFEMLVIG